MTSMTFIVFKKTNKQNKFSKLILRLNRANMDSCYIVSEGTITPGKVHPYLHSLLFAVEQLKRVFDTKGQIEVNRKEAYEKLAEISKIMRNIFERFPSIKNKDIFLNASNLVQAVKVYNYDNYSSESHYQVIDAINKVYSSFQSSLSSFVIPDVKMSSSGVLHESTASLSFVKTHSPTRSSQHEQQQYNNLQQAQQLEDRMLHHPDGLEIALNRAKISSKYLKDIVYYIEKRTQYDIEYNRSIIKNSQTFRNVLNEESCLPFQNVYFDFTSKEIENANVSLKNFSHLIQYFITPLNDYRADFDKQIKKIKDTWARETKRLQESYNNVNKCKDALETRKQELGKIRLVKSSDNYAEWMSQEKMEKKKRTEDDAITRERETRENYSKALKDYNNQQQSVKNLKRELIAKLNDHLRILDLKIKEISFHYFESLKNSMTYSSTQIDQIIDDIQRSENGQACQTFFNAQLEQRPAMKPKKQYYPSHFYDAIDSSESDNSPSYLKYQPQNRMMYREQPSIEKHMMMMPAKEAQTYNQYELDSLSCRLDKNRLFGKPLKQFCDSQVPQIVKQCIKEIEERGSQINGIYRVSGVKSKIEGLCQSLEQNRAIDWSSESPNVIANVLKHFFRELPEPLLTFQLYPEFIKLAQKYSSSVDSAEDVVDALKLIVSHLPKVHYITLKYLIEHLHRISLDSAVNNMPPSNLGIVFGPNLLKRTNEVNASASTLFDTTHQSRAVELLIMFADQIFDSTDIRKDEDEEIKVKKSDSFARFSACQDEVYQKEVSKSSSIKSLPENSFRILKSATCSSIGLASAGGQQTNNSKQSIVEARRQFFNSYSGGNPFDKAGSRAYLNYLSNHSAQCDNSNEVFESSNAELSPFSQITVASSSPRKFYGQSPNKSKRMINFHHHSVIGGGQAQSNDKLYKKSDELSKSSSSLYSSRKPDFSVARNEDMV